MEKAQTETQKTSGKIPFYFPHHKSHLKSQTCWTLVRILSLCSAHPQLREPPQMVSQGLNSDNGSIGMEQASKKEVCEHIELVSPSGIDPGNSLFQNDMAVHEKFEAIGLRDRAFSDTQVVLDEIENLMRIEEHEDLVKQNENDLMGNDCTNGTGLRGGGFGQAQRLLIDELEHVVKGNEEPVHDDHFNLATQSLDGARSCGAFSNNQEELCDRQPIDMQDCREDQQKVDSEHCSQNISETFDSSLCKIMTNEGPKSRIDSDVSKTSELELNHEMLQKELEPEKYIRCGTMDSLNQMIEDGETEEGEISGQFAVRNRSVHTMSEDVIGKSKFPSNEKNEPNKNDFGSTFFVADTVDNAKSRAEVEVKGSARNDIMRERKIVVYGDPILSGEAGWCTNPKKGHRSKKEEKGRGAKKEKKGSGAMDQKKGCSTKEKTKGSKAKDQKKSSVANDGELEVKEGVRNEIVSKCEVVVNGDSMLSKEACRYENQKKACGSMEEMEGGGAKEQKKENLDQNATGSRGITSKKEQCEGPCNKRKRGPPSEEKKAKEKQRKRRKRAEKNRELGVKRLKLRPVVKPKSVSYCRHYLKGRCQEGEKCKFSHDTIPLTKSKPCCHFARHSCMKGDDCPFDHHLSKYPCINFASKGFCSRGKECMFSHELSLKEDFPSTSNVCTPDPNHPSLLDSSNSKKQQDISGTFQQTVKALSNSLGGISCKNTKRNVANSVLDLPATSPKGINLLFAGRSSGVESSQSEVGGSSLKRKDGVEFGNQANQSAPVTAQNLEGIPTGTPPAAAPKPKGINFLSFGKAPLESSSTMKLTSLGINQGDNMKLPLTNNFSVPKLATSSPNMDNSNQVSKEASQSVSCRTPRVNPMLQNVELAVPPPQLNSFPIGEASTSGFRGGSSTQASSPSSSGAAVGTSIQATKISSDIQQTASTISRRLTSLTGSGQSADRSFPSCLKNTPNSVQKALLSTLAFAAKVEHGINRSTSVAPSVSHGINEETGASPSGGLHNDSATAAKILNFLSGVSRTKQ